MFVFCCASSDVHNLLVSFLPISNYERLCKQCAVCSSAQIKVFIEGLISFNQDIPQFKEHLRDFIVQIRVRFVTSLCGYV